MKLLASTQRIRKGLDKLGVSCGCSNNRLAALPTRHYLKFTTVGCAVDIHSNPTSVRLQPLIWCNAYLWYPKNRKINHGRSFEKQREDIISVNYFRSRASAPAALHHQRVERPRSREGTPTHTNPQTATRPSNSQSRSTFCNGSGDGWVFRNFLRQGPW